MVSSILWIPCYKIIDRSRSLSETAGPRLWFFYFYNPRLNDAMAESFTLTVHYKGEERSFDAELRMLGYTHKIAVNINGAELLFEPDEERNYRAVLSEKDINKKDIDPELCQLIAAELEANLK